MEPIRRIVLVGLSGVGKSTVGGLLAERLNWRLIDTDAEVETRAGRPVPVIFEDLGETAFRASERSVLAEALDHVETVIACGGGAVVTEEVWSTDLLGRPQTLVVALDAQPGISLERLHAQLDEGEPPTVRPLLAGDDPKAKLTAMKVARQPFYDRARLTFPVDETPPAIVAGDLARLIEGQRDGTPDVVLETASGASSISIAPGLFSSLGDMVQERWPHARRVWIVTDSNVGAILGAAALRQLDDAGFAARLQAIPPGEGSKSVKGVASLWDWMVGAGIERTDVVVALGGGVVGDVAGFAAATVLRGVGLVQVPTTLQAMVDASVGGKTGINHPAGKNLIGAFYQPQVVVIDPVLLGTVPARELRSGWAEVVKHAVIQRTTPGGEHGNLLPFLERNGSRLRSLDEPVTSYLVRQNVALKAAVVAADEKESGIRAYLNFGHTLGHAIEASDYALLHGEAVALGMRAAARLGQAVGTCGSVWVHRIDAALDAFALPRRVSIDQDRVLELIGSDKKRASGITRWIVPLDGGGVTVVTDLPQAVVRQALEEVTLGS